MTSSSSVGERRRRARVAVVLAVVLSASAVGTFLLAAGGPLVPDGSGNGAAPIAGAEPGGTGSSPTATTTPRPPRNPWRADPIVVGITDATGGNRSYAPLVGDALTYWEAQSATRGAYAANYALRPNATDPDLTVAFVRSVDVCGYTHSELTVGCAPKLGADDYVRGPTTVRVEGDLDDPSTVVTLKHELGHTLGLTHADGDALPFMNATLETTRLPMTDAVDKANPWGTDSLRVYVDYTENVHASEREAYAGEVRDGLDYWNRGAEGYAPANLTLSLVRNESDADVVVRFADSIDTADGTGYLARRRGNDPDGDGRVESFTHATVTVSERGDEDFVDWNVAAAVGYLLGHTENGEVAPPFDGDIEDRDEWAD